MPVKMAGLMTLKNDTQIMAARRNLTISVIRLAGETNIAAALRRYAVHPSRPLALIGAPLQ